MYNRYIQTQDGSFTLYNSKAKEHYHSISGAYSEALKKYIIPLEIENGFKILDFCFGLGYNSFVAVSKYSNLKITALENDIKIIEEIANFPYPPDLAKTVNIFKNLYKNHTITDSKNNTINLVLQDAKIAICNLPSNSFDRIFFDPFSLKKSPEMWTLNIFNNLYNILKPNGKLATYSCAKTVRNNMTKAGFKVYNGPSVGRKSPSTIAVKE